MIQQTDLMHFSNDLRILSTKEKEDLCYSLNACCKWKDYDPTGDGPEGYRKQNFYWGSFASIVSDLSIKLIGDDLVDGWGILMQEQPFKNKQDKRYRQLFRIIKGVRDFMSATEEEREEFCKAIQKAPTKIATKNSHRSSITVKTRTHE